MNEDKNQEIVHELHEDMELLAERLTPDVEPATVYLPNDCS